ncbi:MAG: DUF4276 family protein [Bacteroidia bacterium]
MAFKYYWRKTLMAYLFIIGEGFTEELFYKQIFKEYYINSHFIETVVISTRRKEQLRKFRGGTITFEKCIANCRIHTAQNTQADLILLCLDYYGLHESFFTPEINAIHQLNDRVSAIQERINSQISSHRFRCHLQIHEFEAWLFSDVNKIAEQFGGEGIAELEQIVSRSESPELINDRKETSPAHRLSAIYPGYKKLGDGISIAKQIGIPKIREKCPHFNSLCNIIDQLPKSEGL